MFRGRVPEGRGCVRGFLVVKSNGGQSLSSKVEGRGSCIPRIGRMGFLGVKLG